MQALALDAQRLAAGRQDVEIRRDAQYCRGQSSGCIDQVLAVVEHEQHLLVAQGGGQAGERIFGADFEPKHGSHRARHQPRVAKRREIDQPNPMLIGTN